MSKPALSLRIGRGLLTRWNVVFAGFTTLVAVVAGIVSHDFIVAISVVVAALLVRLVIEWPELAISLVIASSGLALLWVVPGGDKAFLSSGSFLAAAVGALVAFLRNRKAPSKTMIWIIVLTGFVVVVGLVVGMASLPFAQVFAGIRLFVTPILCAFVALTIGRPGTLRLLRFGTVIVVLSFIAAVAEYFLGAMWLADIGLEYGTAVRTIDGALRAPGLFTSNYSLGSFAGVMGALALVWWPSPESGLRANLWRAVAAGASIGCLLLSTYRTGLLVFFVSIVLLIVAGLFKGGTWKPILLAVGSVGLFAFIWLSGLASTSSLFQRLDVWNKVVTTYGFLPLGHGIGFAGAASGSRFAGAPVIVDNYFLNLAFQFGLLALIVVAGLFFVAVVSVVKAHRTPVFAVGYVFVSCLVAFLFVDFWEYTAAMSLACAAVAMPFGMALHAASTPRTGAAGSGPLHPEVDPPLSRGGTVAIWRSTWLPPSETFVRNQATALQRWTPIALGTRKRESPISADSDVILYGASWGEDVARRFFELSSLSQRIRQYLRHNKVDLIHAHFGNEGILISGEAQRSAIPLVITVHGSEVTEAPNTPGLRGWRYRRRLSAAFKSATTVIAVSDFIRQRAIECGAPPERTVVHHIGIPIQDSAGIEGERAGILFVGRLVEKKGVLDLIRAVAALPAEIRDIQVTIVGDGPLRGLLRHEASALGVNVEFLGFQTSAEVRQLMQTCLMYGAASKRSQSGDTEGLPTVVMEAGAAGAAVVGYNHSGIPDAVLNEVTGLLVEEGDHAALSLAIERLVSDPELARALGRAARERIEAQFNIREQSLLLEGIYDAALETARASIAAALV
jgi:colanic acid/amylovoran biosynthesis glycosyltransferase